MNMGFSGEGARGMTVGVATGAGERLEAVIGVTEGLTSGVALGGAVGCTIGVEVVIVT